MYCMEDVGWHLTITCISKENNVKNKILLRYMFSLLLNHCSRVAYVLQNLFLFVNVILPYCVGQCPVYISLTLVSGQCTVQYWNDPIKSVVVTELVILTFIMQHFKFQSTHSQPGQFFLPIFAYFHVISCIS